MPKDRNLCGHCGKGFPIRTLRIVLYDIVKNHEERWENPSPFNDPGQPKYLKSPFFFLSISKRLKHKNLLHSTVPSKAEIDTRSSGPHFGWHLQF